MFSDARPRTRLKIKTDNKPQMPASHKKVKLRSAEDMSQLMEVQGSHRNLFYRQPSTKHFSAYSTVVVDLEAEKGSPKKVSFESGSLALVESFVKEKSSVIISLPVQVGKMATKATQTDFRESEAQTLPWRHEITAKGKISAELMLLENLGLGRNFPPGMEEVMLIEMARQKLEWENIIAKLNGKENESKRKALVVRLAASVASFRDQKFEEANLERMKFSESEMKEGKERFERSLLIRLQKSVARSRTENDLKFDYRVHQLTRQLRKMKFRGSETAAKTKNLGIVALHKDKASELYAPNLRNGENPSRRHEIIDIRCRYLKRFHGLSVLEKHLGNSQQPIFANLKQREFSRAKQLGLCPRKYREKVNKVSEEEKFSGSLSLKVPVPVVDPKCFTTQEPAIQLPISEGNPHFG